MKIDLNDLLPDEISDEAAHVLVCFLENLGQLMGSHYYTQCRRHWQEIDPPRLPDYLQK